MILSFGSARGAPRSRRNTERDRGDARSGWIPAAEADVPVHRWNGAAVTARTGTEASRAASCDSGHYTAPRRTVAARPGGGAGTVTAHVARMAEEGMDARPPGGRSGRSMGGVDRQNRVGPPTGFERMPPTLDSSRAAGRIANARTAPVTDFACPIPRAPKRRSLIPFPHNL